MALADHLGVINTLLIPWRDFLVNYTRIFDIRGVLNTPLTSICGLPEADILNIYIII
jgi:hypothetical protein